MSELDFHPDFVFRTPACSFENITNYRELQTFIKNSDEFEEALYIASPSFHDQFLKWKRGEITEDKELTKLLASLYKYMSRMSSRCTPFGLFAATGVGSWADQSKIELAQKSVKRARMDMDFWAVFVQQIERDSEIGHLLRYYPNNTIRIANDKLRYVEYSCKKCGEIMTGSPSRSRNGNQYFYYHCNICKGDRVNASAVNTAIEEILGALKFDKDANDLFASIVKQRIKSRGVLDVKETSVVETKIAVVKAKLKNTQDLLADGEITPSDYKEMKSRYQSELEKLEKQMKPVEEDFNDEKIALRDALAKIVNLRQLYEAGDIAEKQRIVGSTFPEKLHFLDGKCRTTRLSEAVRLGLSAGAGFRGKEKRQIHEKLDLSHWVVSAGIEPASKV